MEPEDITSADSGMAAVPAPSNAARGLPIPLDILREAFNAIQTRNPQRVDASRGVQPAATLTESQAARQDQQRNAPRHMSTREIADAPRDVSAPAGAGIPRRPTPQEIENATNDWLRRHTGVPIRAGIEPARTTEDGAEGPCNLIPCDANTVARILQRYTETYAAQFPEVGQVWGHPDAPSSWRLVARIGLLPRWNVVAVALVGFESRELTTYGIDAWFEHVQEGRLMRIVAQLPETKSGGQDSQPARSLTFR